MRITEAEHENRRNRMLYAAYELFCEHGIDGVSVAQIAKVAGVSPNSIFRYFESKVQLVQGAQTILWEEVASHLLDSSSQRLALAKSGIDEIEILLSNFTALYGRYSKYILFSCDYKLFLVRNNIMMSEWTYLEMIDPVYCAFITSLKKGQEDGSIDKQTDPDTLFFTMWGVMRGYVDEIVLYDRMYAGKNPWKSQFDFILGGVVEALKTRKQLEDLAVGGVGEQIGC